VPVLEGDFVTADAGTGFVHIAPGHGEDDFYLGVANNIEVTDNITDDGKFRDHVPLFAGLEVYTQKGEMGPGNFAPLKALDEAGKLLAKGSVKHEYPHSWRSKAPVIFRTTPQWFIAMDGTAKGENQTLRETALGAIKETGWIPAKGETRITSMIAGRPDWCISRQRAWGVPIALFVHKETGEVLNDADVFERIGASFEAEGSDVWWEEGAAQRFLGNNYNADDYGQVFDIVDVWFESGSTHAFVLGDDQTWPYYAGVDQADLYLEGSDQHRGWFHSSLLESCGTNGRAPYKNVLTHGFVLDDKGYKMSKSLGNVVDPLRMMEQYGADILRLWVMNSDYAEDIRIGQDTLKNTGDLYRRIRNTMRFLLGALDGFTKDEMIEFFDAPEKLPELEQLMLHELFLMDKTIRTHIENFEFGKIAQALHHFCNQTLSAFYFDIRKDALYCDDPASDKRRACRSVMAVIFNGLTAWLAPILCYSCEEAWQYRPDGVFEEVESVHAREFPEVPAGWHNEELAKRWSDIIKVREQVIAQIEPFRANKEMGSSLEAMPFIRTSNENVLNAGNELADICIVSQIQIEKCDSPGQETIEIKKSEGGKCARCWKIMPEVTDGGQDVCNRCEETVSSLQSKAA
jgi:isoleucyl-tRNA synthetase